VSARLATRPERLLEGSSRGAPYTLQQATGIHRSTPALSREAQFAKKIAAYSPTLRGAGEIASNLLGGRLSWSVPGVPKHFQGILAGGLPGSGFNFGVGYVGEQFLPGTWQRGKLRKSLALAGGALGAAPGLGRMGVNALSGQHPFHDALQDAYPDDVMNYSPSLPGGEPNPTYRPDMPYVPKNQDFPATDSVVWVQQRDSGRSNRGLASRR
jgi:hypothetical protein